MKIKTVVNPQFFNSLNKVLKAEIPVALGWKLRGLVKYLEKTHQSYDEMRKELLTKHSEKDDKGGAKIDETGNVQFTDDAARERFIKDHKELLEQEVELESKIKLSDLTTLKLSTSDLLILEELIEE